MLGRGRRGLLVAGAVVLGATGCSGLNQGSEDAGVAAQRFNDAVDQSDFRQACALLTAPVVEVVEDGEDGSCDRKLKVFDLSVDGPVTRSEAYGNNALVVFGQDTLFLSKSRDGWLVMAAGCTSRGERPQNCEIEGS